MQRSLGSILACGLATTGLLAGVATFAEAAPRLDKSFGEGGIVTQANDAFGEIQGLSETRTGQLVFTGPYTAPDSSCARVLSGKLFGDGRLDPGYGESGISILKAGCQSGSAIGGLTGDRTVVGTDGGDSPCASAILMSGGGENVGWPDGNASGKARLCYGPSSGLKGDRVNQVTIDHRGRILLAGTARWGNSRSAGLLYRLKPNGKRDLSLVGDSVTRSGLRGLVRMNPKARGGSSIRSVRTHGTGKILVAGTWAGVPMVARMSNTGKLDPTFGKHGLFRMDLDRLPCKCSGFSSMIRDYRGRILALGFSARPAKFGGLRKPRLALVRLKPNGTLDRQFGDSGVARISSDKNWVGRSIVVQRNGKIVVSGSLDSRFTLVRFDRNGKVDRGFFKSGFFSPKYFAKFYGSANALTIDRKGRLVAAGGGSGRKVSRNEIQLVRILPD